MDYEETRRDFLRTAGAALAAGAVVSPGQCMAHALEGDQRRNIVFILIDDMRYDSLSMMGHPFLETPRLDALAAKGVFCERAYVTTSLCSPSRASILSGMYAHKHRVLDNSTRLDPAIPTFPQLLQEAGYDTAFIGKWHMGGANDDPQPGFNRWVSFKGQGPYFNPNLNIDGTPTPAEGYTTDLLTDYAVDFLKRERGGKPFMLYLSHKAVHAEFAPAPRHKGRYAGKVYPQPASMANTDANYAGKPAWVRAQRNSWHGVDGMYNGQTDYDSFTRDYCETMLAVDESVGRVVDALEAMGQLDSTLLVFTSDNGFLFGEHGLIDKRCMYEPSARVPLIAHCPEMFKAGRCGELITNIDFAPTFLDAAGLAAPGTMQGASFLRALGGDTAGWREAFLYEYFWERSFAQTPTVLGVRTKRHKFMQYHGVWDRYELYDLDKDPDEMNNLLGEFMVGTESGTLDRLIEQRAQGEVKEIYLRMRERLRRLIEETGCTPEPVWGQ